jgi:hypothetical protein
MKLSFWLSPSLSRDLAESWVKLDGNTVKLRKSVDGFPICINNQQNVLATCLED